MSKRKSKKIKRALRAQMQKQAVQSQPVVENQVHEVLNTGETPVAVQQKQGFLIDPEEQKNARGEIKKILLTVLILAMVIVGIYLVNIKTDFILKIGQSIGDKLGLKG